MKDNIARARRQFFALGSTGCYLGHSNPLTAISVVESCVFPTLLYGAENWILNEEAIKLLENFQAEIGRRILRLSKRHSRLSAFSTSPVLALHEGKNPISKYRLPLPRSILRKWYNSDENTTHSSITGCVQFGNCSAMHGTWLHDWNQCYLCCPEQCWKSQMSVQRNQKIHSAQRQSSNSTQHQSVRLARGINWLRIWETVRDRGPYWSRTAQTFFKVLTFPLFEDRVCQKCSQAIPSKSTYIEHLINSHCSSDINLDNLISELNSDSDLTTETLHSIRVIVSSHHSQSS